jgi:predicted acetyltransferase
MKDVELVEPTKEYEAQSFEYIEEFRSNNSNINGSGGLDRYNNYDEWLKKLESDLDFDNIKPERVPANTYFLLRHADNKIIGMINIRHRLNDYLLKKGGHVGYGIRPTERQKGYATKLLHLGLLKCMDLGIEKVLVTCDKANIGSAKTIQNNGGILENEILDSELGEIVQRYWINVKDTLKRGE